MNNNKKLAVPVVLGFAKSQPLLLLTLDDVFPAYHAAPPVAVESLIDRYDLSILTLLFAETVNVVPDTVLSKDTKLPALPESPKPLNVWVVLTVNMTLAG